MVSVPIVALSFTEEVPPFITRMMSVELSGVGVLRELTVTVTPSPSTVMFLPAKAVPAQASISVLNSRSLIRDRGFGVMSLFEVLYV